jgi:hypothetical protein
MIHSVAPVKTRRDGATSCMSRQRPRARGTRSTPAPSPSSRGPAPAISPRREPRVRIARCRSRTGPRRWRRRSWHGARTRCADRPGPAAPRDAAIITGLAPRRRPSLSGAPARRRRDRVDPLLDPAEHVAHASIFRTMICVDLSTVRFGSPGPARFLAVAADFDRSTAVRTIRVVSRSPWAPYSASRRPAGSADLVDRGVKPGTWMVGGRAGGGPAAHPQAADRRSSTG